MFNSRYMYHAVHAARIVTSQAELESLGVGWAESPQEAWRLAEQPDTSAEQAARLVAEQAAAAEADRAAQVAAQTEEVRLNLERAAADAAAPPPVATESDEVPNKTPEEQLAADAEAEILRLLAAEVK
jgi:hypothetical protein